MKGYTKCSGRRRRQVGRRRDHERRGGGGRRLKLLAHGQLEQLAYGQLDGHPPSSSPPLKERQGSQGRHKAGAAQGRDGWKRRGERGGGTRRVVLQIPSYHRLNLQAHPSPLPTQQQAARRERRRRWAAGAAKPLLPPPHPPLSATPITLPPTGAGAGRGTGRARAPLPCHLPLTRHLLALQKQARAGKATERKKTGPGGGKGSRRPLRALSPQQIFPSLPPLPPFGAPAAVRRGVNGEGRRSRRLQLRVCLQLHVTLQSCVRLQLCISQQSRARLVTCVQLCARDCVRAAVCIARRWTGAGRAGAARDGRDVTGGATNSPP
ncbi:unnamed protein product [Closterium sp. NIES-54]